MSKVRQIATGHGSLRAGMIKVRFVSIHTSLTMSLRTQGPMAIRALYLHIRIIGHFFFVTILVVFFAPIAALLTLRLDAAIQTLLTLLASLDLRLPVAPQRVLHYQLTMILQLTLGLLVFYLATLILAVGNTGSRIWANPRATIFRNSASNSLLRTTSFLVCYATSLLLAQSFEYAVGYFTLLMLVISIAFVAQMTWDVRDIFCELYDRNIFAAVREFSAATTLFPHQFVLQLRANCTQIYAGLVLEPTTDISRSALIAYHHFNRVQLPRIKPALPLTLSLAEPQQSNLSTAPLPVCGIRNFAAAGVPVLTRGPWLYPLALIPDLTITSTLHQLEVSFLRQNLSARAPPARPLHMTPGGGYTFGLFLGTRYVGIVGSRKSYSFRPGDARTVWQARLV